MSWEIEKLKGSIIDSDVRFTTNEIPIRELGKFRRENLSITSYNWITLRAVSSESCCTVYNPRTVIMTFKN